MSKSSIPAGFAASAALSLLAACAPLPVVEEPRASAIGLSVPPVPATPDNSIDSLTTNKPRQPAAAQAAPK